MFAIVAAFKEWRAYLEGAQYQITVLTDHKNLEYFTTTKTLNRRQARWSETLGNYDFVIKYIPGKKNGKPDALSRRPDYHLKGEGTDSRPQTLLKPHQLILAATNTQVDTDINKEIKNTYTDDPITKEILPYLKDNKLTRTPELQKILKDYNYKNDFVLFKNLIYVPNKNDLKLKILKLHHDTPSVGHYGNTKTIELLTRNYTWPKLREFVRDYIISCDLCNRCKPSRHKQYGLLKSLPVPDTPWKSISMDFIVSLPESNNYTAILVIVDRLTKMSHFIPTTNNVDAPQTAQLFFDYIYRYHGLPSDIISDRGSIFTSTFWSELMKLLNVKLNLSTPYHPQTDGQTERVNQSLELYLRLYCDYFQNDWSKLLTLAEFSYNNISHSSTKFSPFFANYGQHPKTLPIIENPGNSISPYAGKYIKNIEKIHKALVTNISHTNELYAKHYNNKRKEPPEFTVKSKVWIDTRNIRTTRPSKKLDYKKIGPFEIIEKISSHAYKLKLPKDVKIHPVFHVSRLEPYIRTQIPNRTQPPPMPIIIDGEIEYEVNRILDSRINKKRLEYLVDWKGYDASHRSWEPQSNLKKASSLIHAFHKLYPDKPRPLGTRSSEGELLSRSRSSD